jgi:hypothetical protein
VARDVAGFAEGCLGGGLPDSNRVTPALIRAG